MMEQNVQNAFTLLKKRKSHGEDYKMLFIQARKSVRAKGGLDWNGLVAWKISS